MPTSLGEQWRTSNYIHVPGAIDPARAARLLEACDYILARWRRGDVPGADPGAPVPPAHSTVMRHLNHPMYFDEHPEWFPLLMDLIADPGILRIAGEVLGDEPLFKCTSLFFNPLADGKDGNWHRDSQFLTKTDDEEKAMLFDQPHAPAVQLQIALVPSEDSEVVPGSRRRWDTAEEYRIRKSDGGKHNRSNAMPGAVRVSLRAGDVVAFDPLALHRGRYHTDKLRRTIMLTYTGSVGHVEPDVFNRQPWFREPGYLEPLKPATRAFFDPFIARFGPSWEA